ncbi:MAG: trypsin-like serine protease [Rhodospirillales bacterium]|nr:trypsin-like serine protease [Rhodospirillales bacterium]
MEEQNYASAAKLYVEQETFFRENGRKYRETISRLAAHLNNERAPAIDEAHSALRAVAWPAPAAEWPAIAKAIAAVEAAAERALDHPLVKEPPHRPAKADALESELRAFKEKIRADATAHFASFDHFGGQSFLDVYPDSELKRPSVRSNFIQSNFTALREKLGAAKAEHLKRFASAYPKEALGEAHWSELGNLYTGTILKAQAGGARPDLARVVEAVNASRREGFDVRGIPNLKIAFIEVTSLTLLKQRQIDFPAAVEVDLPVEVEKADLDQALTSATAQAADYLIVFDVALAKASRRVSEVKKIPSKVLVGYEKVPNPAHDVAQAQMMRAQGDYMAAQIQSSVQPSYATPGAALLGGLGNLIGSIAARSQIDEATKALQNTPRFLEKPVHQDYQFDKAEVKATKTMTVHYYVIDKVRQTYFKSTFDVIERKNFEVTYSVDERDTDRSAHISRASTEKDVVEWEEAAQTVKLSHLLDHYAQNAGQAQKLPDLAKLRQEMLADKNQALARFEAMKFDARPLNDSRFDSVVVIYAAAARSMGSGFFIMPDVVLTNWHVVENSQFVEMKMYNKQETFGKVIAKDVRLDLALVKVQSRGKPVQFFTGKTLDLGATTEAIGHPNRLEFSITRGIVSALRKRPSINLQGGGKDILYIQTDTPTNPGNSGGPLFLGDKVIGVNTWGQNLTDDGKRILEGLGFAVHYSEALEFLREHLPEFAGWKGAGG